MRFHAKSSGKYDSKQTFWNDSLHICQMKNWYKRKEYRKIHLCLIRHEMNLYLMHTALSLRSFVLSTGSHRSGENDAVLPTKECRSLLADLRLFILTDANASSAQVPTCFSWTCMPQTLPELRFSSCSRVNFVLCGMMITWREFTYKWLCVDMIEILRATGTADNSVLALWTLQWGF